MAAAVVSTLKTFGDLIVQEAKFLGGFPDGAEWLYRELHWIQCFLKVADSKGRRGDDITTALARDIRDVAYDMEDLTDIIGSMSRNNRQRRGFLSSILRYVSHPVEYSTIHKVVSDIQRIKNIILDISNRIRTYGNIEVRQGSSRMATSSSTSNSGNVEENIGVYRHYEADEDVVGFDKDKKELVSRLLDAEEINQRRSVISIVGMGGIGKTTLARKLYNDSEVNRHFQVLCWVTVSQSYRAADILKTIAKKTMVRLEREQLLKMGDKTTKRLERERLLKMERLTKMTEEEVRDELAKHFEGKRYLIVLDDVWDTRAWPQMEGAFPDCQNGSRIILTSRNIDIARSADPLSGPYFLACLDDEDSWKLLRKKAFPSPKGIEPSCPKQLEDIGRKLAKKCGGLALALVMLGGLMFKKGPYVTAWMESIDWEAIKQHETRCFDILALSYHDLPSDNLRLCFLYLASFPEDSEISASTLIRFWIAEGFIQQKHNRRLEQTAMTYLDELVQRCMVQVTKKSIAHGWVRRVRIHDVLREWCIAEARREEFLYVFNKLENNDSPSVDGMSFRRVALLDKMDDRLHVHFPKLRTLLVFNDNLGNATTGVCFNYFSEHLCPSSLRQIISFNHSCLLRVLDLRGTKKLRKIPNDIKHLMHLRYLGLRRTAFEIIPSSIGELQYLQTLDARWSEIKQFPRTLWRIPTLRNVYSAYIFRPMRTSRIPNCKTLHVVKWIKAGKWIERLTRETYDAPNFHKLAITDIRKVHLSSLSQLLRNQHQLVSLELAISKWNGTRIVTDILSESFSNNHQLRSLYLQGCKFLTDVVVLGPLPRACEFLPNLTKLVLVHFMFLEDPMEKLEQLPSLLHLCIGALSDDEVGRRVGDSSVKSFKRMTCAAGGFPNLQRFEFWGSDVEEWKVEISAMPRLTQFFILGMEKLRNIPDGLLHIISLNELMFNYMSSEFVDRIREGDDVSWNIIRDENKGELMTIVPIRPISSNIAIDSTNNVLPDANYGGGGDVAALHDVTNPQ
ncbi:disease resistance RPP13-like protein 3 [Canna indica]|uniref:Disease resistance RPP13-like protein 3 n=1 Tax=Canna indica TaxID=4628 RepID=A0AAQ3KVN2_9LILI|nr:disease resistance RPP13-like protein 3 [Canna indica]